MSSPPFKVKAIFEYASPHDDDLHFPSGQIITVTEEEDEDWYVGEYVDASGEKQEGIFPRNFVEKYEPTAPPRPTRTNRPKKEPEAAPAPAPASVVEPVKQPEPEPEPEEEVAEVPVPAAREPPPPAPKAEIAPPPQATQKSAQIPKQSAPPPVSEKPSGGSFRDRIAAFNKAAPPPAPFKPGGLSSGSNTFIKKPFVAPPPSKNSYVPLPQQSVPTQKYYRREEDPEIAAKELENQEQAEKAGLSPTSPDRGDEDQPKPTSLKERIALLQKQQMEQAARHADAAAKKEKPKRPAKKRTESHDTLEEGDGAALERLITEDTIGNHSIESVKEESNVPRRRKSSKGAASLPAVPPRNSFGDGNEADMSGAGDTTEEPEEMSTGRDDSDEKPRTRAPLPPRAPSARAPPPTREPDVGDEEGATEQGEPQGEESEEEEEDDIDPEVRRKEELRARMAKMSGGMGMGMMFGAPMPTALPKKKKQSSGSSEKRPAEHGNEEAESLNSAPPVPMIPMPGMTKVRSPEESNEHDGDDHEASPVTSIRPAHEIPDVEDVVPERGAPPPVPSQTTHAAPPVPGVRAAPPPIPKETRPAAPPPLSTPMSPSAGSESDDELSERATNQSLTTPIAEAPKLPPKHEAPVAATSPSAKRASYFPADTTSPTSPVLTSNKRASRLPPPIPGTPSA